MRQCAVDKTLNEKINTKQFLSLIDPTIADVKVTVLKNNLLSKPVRREKLERFHLLFISLPRKKMTYEFYIDLIDYIDVGGGLVLTLPTPPWDYLGRFFEEFRKDLGFNFTENYTYGKPRIPVNTRFYGCNIADLRAQGILYNTESNFLKEAGIKKQIPLVFLDSNPIALASYKRRGRFILFSSYEIFNSANSDFINRFIRLTVNRVDYEFPKTEKKRVADSNFFMNIQEACLDTYLLSLYHHNHLFYQDSVKYENEESLVELILYQLKKRQILAETPAMDDIAKTLETFKLSRNDKSVN